MEDRTKILIKLNDPIFLDKDKIEGLFNITNSIKINANISDEELNNIDWFKTINKRYIVIDMDESEEKDQRRFLSIIKDKKYKSFCFDNIKVIITSSSVSNVCNEVLRLLLIN